MKINIDTSAFKAAMAEKQEKIAAAMHPMARAGAKVIYDGAKANAPVSTEAHMFYGTASANAPAGGKKALAYGQGIQGGTPYAPGTLRDAIYYAHSKDNSDATKTAFHVGWNHKKVPYGFMVEFGTSHSAPHSCLGKARVELSAAASDAMEMEFERRMAE